MGFKGNNYCDLWFVNIEIEYLRTKYDMIIF